jgi:hypothetical protein
MPPARRFNSRRIIMKIEVLPDALRQYSDLCNSLGLTHVATTSRLIEWLCEQSDVIQAAILGLYPEDIRAELPSLILKAIAAEKQK